MEGQSNLAPWATEKYSATAESLNKEITDFFNWIRPTDADFDRRQNALDRMKNCLAAHRLTFDVSMVGSVSTLMFLPTSDVDSTLITVGWDYTRQDVIWWLYEIGRILQENEVASKIQVLPRSSVPLLTITDRISGIEIDVTIGCKNSVKTREFVLAVQKRYPLLQPLVIIVKKFLMSKQLHKAFDGGLSSHGVFLLIYFFLEKNKGALEHREIKDVDMGDLLKDFFKLMVSFDYKTQALSFQERCFVQRPGWLTEVLAIQDPVVENNGYVQSMSYRFEEIKNVFLKALNFLESSVTTNKDYFDGSFLNRHLFTVQFVEQTNVVTHVTTRDGQAVAAHTVVKSSVVPDSRIRQISGAERQMPQQNGPEGEIECINLGENVENNYSLHVPKPLALPPAPAQRRRK